jgi:hypothetical protein
MRKPGIPTVDATGRMTVLFMGAIKENIEILTGARPQIGKIQKLPADATLEQTVAKLNEVISRLNFDGD